MIITVERVDWPQDPSKKQGAVIDTQGKKWGVWRDKLAGYIEGQSYQITHKSNVFNGVEYFTIQTAQPVASGGAPAQRASNTSAAAPPPRPVPDDNLRRMDIFVCAGFKAIMGNPNIQPERTVHEMVNIISTLKAAWKLTLGPQADERISSGVAPAAGAGHNDMNDDIPFGPETRG